MDKKKILAFGLLAAAAYTATQGGGEKQETTTPPPPPPPLPSGGGLETTTTQTGGGSQTAAARMGATNASSCIDSPINEERLKLLRTWSRQNMKALFYTAIERGATPLEAAQQIWAGAWRHESNPYKNLFVGALPFMLDLITESPQPPRVAQSFNISWDSTPVYDTLNNWYNGVTPWACTDWITWHKRLESRYQNTYLANDLWLSAWQNPDNQCYVLGLIGCPDNSYCRYKCEEFVKYLYSKDITVGNLISNSYCSLETVIKNVLGAAEDISKGLSNTAKIAQYALPVALGYLGYEYTTNLGKKIRENE